MAGTLSTICQVGSFVLDAWNTGRFEQERSSRTNETNTSNNGRETFKHVVKRCPPDIKDFKSLQEPFKEVLELLKKDKFRVICIHGMVGIGKTTIMENVNDDNDVANTFDIVIWLSVSTKTNGSNKSIEQLQQDIMQRLNLNIEDAKAISHGIRTKLQGMNYLLLLDNVKQSLNLNEIGIPRGGKIVLTSTSRLGGAWFSDDSSDICTDKMIEVKLMSKLDAWNMFKLILDSRELIEKKMYLAWLVCNNCFRLPLLIAVQARSFKEYHEQFEEDENWRVWTDKARQGIHEIFDRLKKCYNRLDDAKKKCFLYCALYPVECEIDSNNLSNSWVAEDFLSDCNDAQAQENSGGNGNDSKLSKAKIILVELEKASWLGKRGGHYIMQRIMRDAALDFCSDGKSDFMLVVSTGKVSEEDWEKWSGKKYISLTYGVERLSGTPKCSNLSSLLLQKNQKLDEIPDSFFDGMKELRVLDLSGTGIKSILEFELNKIKVLCLRDCIDLSVLRLKAEQLEKLDVLDIRGVTKLPKEVMDNLKALKCTRT